MASLAVYYKPFITHLSDDDNRTLCGIDIPGDWESGGFVWEDEQSALCGCSKCQRIADKRAEQAAKDESK